MRISDWSSDVCSSDLTVHPVGQLDTVPVYGSGFIRVVVHIDKRRVANRKNERRRRDGAVNRYPSALLTGIIDRAVGNVQVIADRKSVVSGKSVSVRVDLGGRRIIKKKKTPLLISANPYN